MKKEEISLQVSFWLKYPAPGVFSTLNCWGYLMWWRGNYIWKTCLKELVALNYIWKTCLKELVTLMEMSMRLLRKYLCISIAINLYVFAWFIVYHTPDILLNDILFLRELYPSLLQIRPQNYWGRGHTLVTFWTARS